VTRRRTARRDVASISTPLKSVSGRSALESTFLFIHCFVQIILCRTYSHIITIVYLNGRGLSFRWDGGLVNWVWNHRRWLFSLRINSPADIHFAERINCWQCIRPLRRASCHFFAREDWKVSTSQSTIGDSPNRNGNACSRCKWLETSYMLCQIW
jgi:hypothetical protein